MVDREKVIKGLRECITVLSAHVPERYIGYSAEACLGALELLKERAPVEPKEVNMYPHGQYACGFCGHISVGSKDYHAKYCPECGRALKWE